MNNQLQIFENEEFGKLEILTINGKPYFPATECSKTLGYSNPRKAILDHCTEDGVTIRDSIDRLGRTQEKKYINEGNLYRLIIRSKLPAAARFEAWVMDEVLPTIRKHGAYLTDAILEDAIKSQEYAFELLQRLQAEKNKTDALLGQVQTLSSKAQYCDRVLMSGGVVPVSIIAKDYGMTAMAFNRLLHHLGIQFKLGGAWLLYSRYQNKGYTKSQTFCTPKGVDAVHTYWTQKGRRFLYDTLRGCGIYLLTDFYGDFEEDLA